MPETILIIDDSIEILLLLKNYILEPAGYQIITAKDGLAGLHTAIECKPDLVLLDMNLPYLSGLEILAELRRVNCCSPVIFMTTFGSEKIAVEAFRLGVRDYLSKPFTREEVIRSVDKALNETRLRRESEMLNHNLATAEAVRTTVVTLSHYINNHLMTLNGGLTLLDETLTAQPCDPNSQQILGICLSSVKGIRAVLEVLRRTADVNLALYAGSTPMLDIQAALQEELEKLA